MILDKICTIRFKKWDTHFSGILLFAINCRRYCLEVLRKTSTRSGESNLEALWLEIEIGMCRDLSL